MKILVTAYFQTSDLTKNSKNLKDLSEFKGSSLHQVLSTTGDIHTKNINDLRKIFFSLGKLIYEAPREARSSGNIDSQATVTSNLEGRDSRLQS